MLEPKLAYDRYKQKPNPFGDIVGYDDLRELLTKCLAINDSCNLLLSGPPASSKTIFLLSMLNCTSCMVTVENKRRFNHS
jgi:hypothetical protein